LHSEPYALSRLGVAHISRSQKPEEQSADFRQPGDGALSEAHERGAISRIRCLSPWKNLPPVRISRPPFWYPLSLAVRRRSERVSVENDPPWIAAWEQLALFADDVARSQGLLIEDLGGWTRDGQEVTAAHCGERGSNETGLTFGAQLAHPAFARGTRRHRTYQHRNADWTTLLAVIWPMLLPCFGRGPWPGVS
jgi:hypothetical protein